MLEGTYAYPMSIKDRHAEGSITPAGSAEHCLTFAQFDKSLRGTVHSMYFFSKGSGVGSTVSAGDYDWSPFNGARSKALYQVALSSSGGEVLWSRKFGYLIDSTSKIHPHFSLALDGQQNSGFVIHQDIYGISKMMIIYPFEYTPTIPASWEWAIHQFQADQETKKEAVYFYIMLTESPTEVNILILNRWFICNTFCIWFLGPVCSSKHRASEFPRVPFW